MLELSLSEIDAVSGAGTVETTYSVGNGVAMIGGGMIATTVPPLMVIGAGVALFGLGLMAVTTFYG